MAANAGGIKAGHAYVEIGAKDKTGLTLDKVKEKLKKFGESATKIGLGVMAAGGAILGGLAKIVQFTVETGTELELASRKTGETVENLSRLRQAAAESGMSFEELTRQLEASGEGLDEIRARASQLNSIMSGESAKAAKAFGDELGQLETGVKSVVIEMGMALLPTLKEIIGPVIHNVRVLVEWVKANRMIVVGVGALGVALVAAGATLVAIGGAAMGFAAAIVVLKAAIAAISAALGFLISPLGIALVAIIALFATAEDGRKILGELANYFTQLWNRVTESWQGITDAIRAGEWELALNIVWSTIRAEFSRGIKYVRLAWSDLVDWFEVMWVRFQHGFSEAWHAVKDTHVRVILNMIDRAQDLWDNFGTYLQNSIEKTFSIIGKVAERAMNVVQAHIQKVFTSLRTMAQLVWEAAKNPLAVHKKIGNALGLSSSENEATDSRTASMTAEADKAIEQAKKAGIKELLTDKEFRNQIRGNLDAEAAKRAAQGDGTDAVRARQQAEREALKRQLDENIREADEKVRRLNKEAAEKRKAAEKPKGNLRDIPAIAEMGIAKAAKGTFSSFGISQALAINDKLAERTAKGVEKTAVNTAEIAKKIGVLTFV